jgi:hypothetical protein
MPDRNKVSRPVSAPVRRTKPTYAAALRDRVNQPFLDHVEDDGQHGSGSGVLRAKSEQEDDRMEDSAEYRRLMRLLEEEVRPHVMKTVRTQA